MALHFAAMKKLAILALGICAFAQPHSHSAKAQSRQPTLNIDGDPAPPTPTRIGNNKVRITGRAGPTARALNRMGDAVPLPKPRPSPLAGTIDDPDPLPDSGASQRQHRTATLPLPRPSRIAPTPRQTAPERAPARLPRAETQPEAEDENQLATAPLPLDNACLEALQSRADAVRAVQPDANDPQCTIPDPVELRALGGDSATRFTAGLTLDCRFATRLVTFMHEIGQPLARDHMGAELERLYTGQGFVCRRRNNALTGKLSEHSFGNAIDIVSFGFGGGATLPVRAASDMQPKEADFFRAFRRASCGYFTTVLGPGSNQAHATHLHFDLGREDGSKKRAYRICE